MVQWAALPMDSTYYTATNGTVGCSTRGLSLPLYYRWHSRLHFQGSQSHLTVTAGTVGCGGKGLSLIALVQLVQ